MTCFISFKRPETGAVGSKHFITDDNVSVLVKTELKLGVRNDDAFGQCVIRTFLIKGDGAVTKLGCIFLTFAGINLFQYFNGFLVRDVLVMVTDFGLGGRRIDGLGQLVGFL